MQPFDSMVGDSMARPLAVSAPVGSPTLELVGTVGGMLPAEIP